MDRETEMKICLKEQGYYISISDRIYFDCYDIWEVEDIIKSETAVQTKGENG